MTPPSIPVEEGSVALDKTDERSLSSAALPQPPSQPEVSPGSRFWQAVGRGALAAGRLAGRGALAAGQGVVQAGRALDPALVRFVAQAPLMGLTHLAPRNPLPGAMEDDGHRLVVCIHGLGGHRGNFLPMECYLRCMGRSRVFSVGFDDTSSIQTMAERLGGYLHGLVQLHGLDPEAPSVDLICHSMGGIIARVALEDPGLAAMVGQVITMGTPHQGTELARLAQTHKILDLRPGSSLLERLERQLPWRPRSEDGAGLPPLTCLWSDQDLVIMPPEAARVEGASHVQMEGFTHLSFLLHPRGWHQVFAALSLTEERRA